MVGTEFFQLVLRIYCLTEDLVELHFEYRLDFLDLKRKQYFDLYPNDEPSRLNDKTHPAYEKFTTPFKIALSVWTKLKDENKNTASFYANQKSGNNLGTFRSFFQTFHSSQSNYKDRDIDKSAKAFQKVLEKFTFNNKPLIDFFNP